MEIELIIDIHRCQFPIFAHPSEKGVNTITWQTRALLSDVIYLHRHRRQMKLIYIIDEHVIEYSRTTRYCFTLADESKN